MSVMPVESKLTSAMRRHLSGLLGADTTLCSVAYTSYSRALHRFILRMIGRNEARDVMRETYSRLLNRDTSMTPNPVAYTFTVAQSVCDDLGRDEPVEDFRSPKLSHAFLNQLPLEQRIAVLRFYRDGRNCAEIARELAQSERSVERSLFRARLRLRKMIASENRERL